MGRKHYIPNFNKYVGKNPTVDKSLIQRNEEFRNVIELNTEKEIQEIIRKIRKTEYINYNEIETFFLQVFPEFQKELKTLPIDMNQFKVAITEFFRELPPEVFEGKNVLEVIKKIYNAIMANNEMKFLIYNLPNGNLLYDESYKYPKYIFFKCKMLKLNHNLETSLNFMYIMQLAFEKAYFSELVYANKELTRKDLDLFNRIFNITGQAIHSFKTKVGIIRLRLQEERRFLKKTTIKPPAGYNKAEKELKECLAKCDNIIEQLDNKTFERKTKIQELLRGKKIITRENLELFLEYLKTGWDILSTIFGK